MTTVTISLKYQLAISKKINWPFREIGDRYILSIGDTPSKSSLLGDV